MLIGQHLHSLIRLKAKDVIGQDEVIVEGRDKGKKTELALAPGERVRFTAKNRDLGVVNGTQATIQSVKRSRASGYGITGVLRSENQKENVRKVAWNTHEHKALTCD